MKTRNIIISAIATIVVVFGITLVGTYLSVNNEEKQLRNLAEAQRGKIETQYDAMWKIIQQKAKVTDEYKDSFKEIFVGIIDGRYSQGDGSLMKWIQESNPNFDSSMYKDLMATIDIKRTEFMNTQNRMLDIIREHKNLCMMAPKCWFVSNNSEIEYTIISSTKSKATMQTGIEDDIELFNKEK